jgi:hypothetical protein
MNEFLQVTIPDHNRFYSLYADGRHSWKTYDREAKATLLHYPPGAAVFLYYAYPTHREACVIRNSRPLSGTALPGLSAAVSILILVHASRVDKLKRAASFLNAHSPSGAFGQDDGFYVRLGCVISQKGKLNYPALRNLAARFTSDKQFFLN